MWKEYAATLGKGADSLTLAEKRQAEYVGILTETRFQIGDAAKLSREFAGQQAQNVAATLKLKQAFGEALAPALGQFLSVITPVIKGLTDIIKAHPDLVAAMTGIITAFVGLVTAVAAVGGAIAILGPALEALGVTLLGLMANPVVLALTAIAGAIAFIGMEAMKAKKRQEEFNTAVEKYNKIRTDGITKTQVTQTKEEVAELQKLIKGYEDMTRRYNEWQAAIKNGDPYDNLVGDFSIEMGKYATGFEKFGIKIKNIGDDILDARKRVEDLKEAIFEANRVTTSEYLEQSKSIAVKQKSNLETQNLINTYRNASKGSKEWYDSQKKLADQFPQFSSASGIQIDAIQKVTEAQNKAIQAEWAMLQSKIKITKLELQNIIALREAKLKDLEADQKRATTSIWNNDSFLVPGSMQTAQKKMIDGYGDAVSKARTSLQGLKDDLEGLNGLDGIDLLNVTGVDPIDTDTAFKAYENKALESQLRLIEHKKRLNEISLEDEQSILEQTLANYTNTVDEKMDLEERIFDVKQAIRDRDTKAEKKAIEDRQKLWEDEASKLQERTTNSFSWITREKATDNLDTQGEIDAYSRIIKYHQEYLNTIMEDEQRTSEDKQKIYNDEINFIKDQQTKIYDIQKASVEKAVNNYIESKKKQYDEEESLEDKRLNDKLKNLEKEYSDKERSLKQQDRNNQLESLQAQEKLYVNAQTKEAKDRLAEIRKEISSLQTDAEQEKYQEEKDQRREAIELEISDNKEKYKKLKDEVDKNQKELLAASGDFAKQANNVLVDASNTLKDSISSIIKDFNDNNKTMMDTALEKLKAFIQDYKNLMSQFSLQPITGSDLGKPTAGNNQVVINDYGDKILNNQDDAGDYTDEMFNAAINAMRRMGRG